MRSQTAAHVLKFLNGVHLVIDRPGRGIPPGFPKHFLKHIGKFIRPFHAEKQADAGEMIENEETSAFMALLARV